MPDRWTFTSRLAPPSRTARPPRHRTAARARRRAAWGRALGRRVRGPRGAGRPGQEAQAAGGEAAFGFARAERPEVLGVAGVGLPFAGDRAEEAVPVVPAVGEILGHHRAVEGHQAEPV